jgi:hypothetical protein
MESMEDRTMKLSGLPPFPQSLEIAKERRLPHSHRTTTTDISTLQRHGHLNFAATEKEVSFQLSSNRRIDLCSFHGVRTELFAAIGENAG